LEVMLLGVKGILRHALPLPGRLKARQLWESLWDWVDALVLQLQFTISRAPRPKFLLFFGFAPGDDLLCTTVLRELRKRDQDGLLMISNHRELFAGNKDPCDVHPLWRRYSPYASTVSICERYVRASGGTFIRPEYAPLEDSDRSRSPARHIIAEMCAATGITGPIEIRPYFTPTDAELDQAAWARGRIVIQSSGMAARHPIRNKQWAQERFQGVVDALCGEAKFIQLGSTYDPKLQNTDDLRGATSIRETAAILSRAYLYVGTVGFLMHLARAVECPSVIIYGGREAPWQSGYVCNFNIYTEVPCAPCWRWNSCDLDRKCMSDISVADVVSAIRQMMAKPRGPLSVETVNV
jgi:hypothetical protein